MSTPLDILLSRLDKVRKSGSEWQALCPAHDDHNPSLGIKETDEGILLVNCHTGCSTHDVMAAVGMTQADLYPEHLRKGRRGAKADPNIAARIEKAKADRKAARKKEFSEKVQDAHNSWNWAATPFTLNSNALGHAWARDYLRSRGDGILEAAISAGCRVLPTASKASYNPDTKTRAPCVLWPTRDPRSGDLVSVQREWGRGHLNKKMQGRHMVPIDPANPDVLHSGVIRFPGKRGAFCIYEGPVNAAAGSAATGDRGVSLLDTAGIAKPSRTMVENAIRDGAKGIIIAGDSDPAGIKAALAGIYLMQTWGLKVPVKWTVPPIGWDWADLLELGDLYESRDGELIDGREIVRAAMVSGERPIPPPQKKIIADATGKAATIWSIQAWRPASEPVLPCATVPVADARIILQEGVRAMVEDYTNWLCELDERREQKTKGRLPLAKPWLFKPTTGTGKTTEIKALIHNAELLAAGGSVLALVPTHDQADAYEASGSGWWHYYGRNPDPASPGYCPNYKALTDPINAHHIAQKEFCHRCPNGLKWAGKTEDLAYMGFVGESLAKLETCVWQQHLRDTMEHQFIVAPMGSFSETLASWAPDGIKGDAPLRHRLVTVDEHAQIAVPVGVGLPDIDLWSRRTSDTLRALEIIQAKVDAVDKAAGGPSDFKAIQEATNERKERIAAAKAALELFKTLASEMARMVGKEGRISLAQDLLNAVQHLLETDDEDVAAWERLEFGRDGTLTMTPLRAAWAIRQTLKYEDGHVKDGKLHISGVRPLIDRIGKRPIACFDATPDPVIVDTIHEHKGHIIQALATQHIKIIRKPGRFWGLKALGKNATPEERKRVIKQYKALRAIHPRDVLLVHKKIRVILDPDGTDELLGHWGADHRAHDNWAGKNLVIVGSFFPPMDTWRGQYQAARVAALSAGADPANWPEWPDDMEMETGAWVNEGTHEVQSKLPLPSDPHIRKWLLDTITAETIQAIGRVRGANLDPAHPGVCQQRCRME